jgi:hypothetical protein
MDPITVSAKFAAYTWISEVAGATPEQASRFAEENWRHFLHAADKGTGRLLARLAKPRRKRAAFAR